MRLIKEILTKNILYIVIEKLWNKQYVYYINITIVYYLKEE
jgi:hypothetical protein